MTAEGQGNNILEKDAVLLVEDRQSFVDEVIEMLDGSGIKVTHVDTLESEEAHDHLRKTWLCVLLDLNVPPHEGTATVIRARQLTTNSIVVLTGHGRQEYEVKVIQAGADDYLLKHSITRVDLIRTIRVAGARHIRKLSEDEASIHLRAQMQVLGEIAALMVEIRDWLKPKPVFKDFFKRLSSKEGRAEIESQLKAASWFVGRIIVEIAAIIAALKGLEKVAGS